MKHTTKATLALVTAVNLFGVRGIVFEPRPVQTKETPTVVVQEEPKKKEFHEVIVPLANLISSGEGNWDSVNRGWAGDTPGGIVWLTGRSFSQMTVNEVINMQRWKVYAVGRYQFIPSTLLFAVRQSGVSGSPLTPEIQNRLFAALLEHKRPHIAAYIRGEHNNKERVLRELAMEWASIEYRWGQSYYGYGGNRAHISREQVSRVIDQAREELS